MIPNDRSGDVGRIYEQICKPQFDGNEWETSKRKKPQFGNVSRGRYMIFTKNMKHMTGENRPKTKYKYFFINQPLTGMESNKVVEWKGRFEIMRGFLAIPDQGEGVIPKEPIPTLWGLSMFKYGFWHWNLFIFASEIFNVEDPHDWS